jgi:RNA 2',3'-cyclic 3'-phosphodiesterase
VTAEADEKLVRAFVAIELEDQTRARLAELMRSLHGVVTGARWVRPEGIHLTLRFLGYARRTVLDSLVPALRRAAEECPATRAVISGLGVFPEQGRARVLFVGIAVPPSILRLQEACERAAEAAGFEAETRAFRPHLTLARWKEPARRPSLPEADLGPASLDTLVLYRSQPGRTGSVYTPIETFALAPPAAAPA